MQDDKQDRIQRDAADIAATATDIEGQRTIEMGARSKMAEIDAQIEELKRQEVEQEGVATKAHTAIVADERRIAEDDRDLREALNGGGPPAPPSTQPSPPTESPAPGPGNPPVVPPRRVG